jgi:hypothetical protein
LELKAAVWDALRNPDEPSIAMVLKRLGNDTATGSRISEGEMKKTQRLSIEIQHREVVIAVEGPMAYGEKDAAKETGRPEAICEVCGSPWIVVAVHGAEEAVSSANNVHRALEQAGMHLRVSADGELSICRKSLEDLKEKR